MRMIIPIENVTISTVTTANSMMMASAHTKLMCKKKKKNTLPTVTITSTSRCVGAFKRSTSVRLSARKFCRFSKSFRAVEWKKGKQTLSRRVVGRCDVVPIKYI